MAMIERPSMRVRVRKLKSFRDASDKPVVGKLVDPEYLRVLDEIATTATCIVEGGMTSTEVLHLEELLTELEGLEPRQNRFRTDKEVEERL